MQTTSHTPTHMHTNTFTCTQTHMHVFKGVGLVVPSQVFPPDKFTDQIDIVVGTPTSIETILTSKRVKGFDFDFAVFDFIGWVRYILFLLVRAPPNKKKCIYIYVWI